MVDIDNIMQAAERLRIAYSTHNVAILDEHYVDDDGIDDDAHRLARFALSILPKGKRPVALGSVTDGSYVWFAENGRCLHVPVRLREHTGEYLVEIDGSWVNSGACNLFASKEDAELELEWEQFEAIHGR